MSTRNDECCETECDERPQEIPQEICSGKYPITIHHLDFGYNVKIGCQNFAIETVETLIKNLDAYLKDPSGTEKKWMKEKKLL